MAPKYTKKKTYKKKQQQLVKRPNPRLNRDNVVFGNGFPKKICVTHKYSDMVIMNSTSGSFATFLWSANGMYDPNVTAGGHQPMLFDQIGLAYDHWVVIASKATFKFMPRDVTTASGQCPVAITVMYNDDVSLISNSPIVNAEQTGSKIRFLQMDPSSSLTMTKTFSAEKTYGKGVLANNKLQGTPTTNPIEQTFYQICIQSADGVSTNSIICHALIEYTAVWTELKDIPQS